MKNVVRDIEVRPATSLPADPATFVVFQAALGIIPQATFVTDEDGQIIHANALGYERLRCADNGIRRSLVQAVQGLPTDRTWRLTPLEGAGSTPGFIAVLELSRPPTADANGQHAAASRWKLTPRQAQVLDLVAGGATNARIAETLGIKERTVEFHLSAIFDKAGVDNRATLFARLLAL